MNIVVGFMSLATLVFLSTSTRVPEIVRPDGVAAVIAASTASFMIFSSVMALVGKPMGRHLMLVSALIFYGMLVFQNAILVVQPDDGLGPQAGTKLIANVVRSSLEIAINVWALLSAKTRRYFGGAATAP